MLGALTLDPEALDQLLLGATLLSIDPTQNSEQKEGSIRFLSSDRGLEFWTIGAHFACGTGLRIRTMPGIAINMTARGRLDGVDRDTGRELGLGGKIGALIVPTTVPAEALARVQAGAFFNARLWLSSEWLHQAATDDPLVETLIPLARDHLALRRVVATSRMIAAGQEAARGDAGSPSPLCLETAAYEILLEVIDQVASDARSHAKVWRTALTPERAERMEQVRSLLVANLAVTPSLRELARAVGTNVRRLKEDFPFMYGRTVLNFLRESRMIAAAELLRSGRCNVAQAARATGYTHQANFARVFRQYSGVSPREFLKR